MSDKQKLTKRERFMLVLVIIVAITVGGTNFIVFPLYDSYLDMSEKLENLTYTKEELDFELANEALTHILYERTEEEYNDILARYPIVMSNEEIDTVLTTLCLDNSIRPISLSLSGPSVSSFYTKVSASMSISCNYSALRNLIDGLEEIDYLRIVKISLKDVSNYENMDTQSFSLVFEVTMFNG